MLGDSNPVYYKTETIMLFLNYLSSKVGENKIGEQSTFRGQTVLLTKRRLGKKKRHKLCLSKIGGGTPKGHSTLKNINKLLILS